MSDTTIDIHSFIERSVSNGPGERFSIWFQGCTLGCPGCFNPETHAQVAEPKFSIRELLEKISKTCGIEGVTISGGEPFQQPSALLKLVQGIRYQKHLSTILFTGYQITELKRMPVFEEVCAHIDVLIAGRFIRELRLGQNLIGSKNKEMHFFSSRYSKRDFEQVSPAEVIISSDGSITLSGIDPLVLEGFEHGF